MGTLQGMLYILRLNFSISYIYTYIYNIFPLSLFQFQSTTCTNFSPFRTLRHYLRIVFVLQVAWVSGAKRLAKVEYGENCLDVMANGGLQSNFQLHNISLYCVELHSLAWKRERIKQKNSQNNFMWGM
jgi:hypothetical protein